VSRNLERASRNLCVGEVVVVGESFNYRLGERTIFTALKRQLFSQLNGTVQQYDVSNEGNFHILYNEPGSCHKRQTLQAPTPQAPIRSRQTRKFATAILT